MKSFALAVGLKRKSSGNEKQSNKMRGPFRLSYHLLCPKLTDTSHRLADFLSSKFCMVLRVVALLNRSGGSGHTNEGQLAY